MEEKEKGKNLDKYVKLISNKSLINDVGFFKKSLSCSEQKNMIQQCTIT